MFGKGNSSVNGGMAFLRFGGDEDTRTRGAFSVGPQQDVFSDTVQGKMPTETDGRTPTSIEFLSALCQFQFFGGKPEGERRRLSGGNLATAHRKLRGGGENKSWVSELRLRACLDIAPQEAQSYREPCHLIVVAGVQPVGEISTPKGRGRPTFPLPHE